MLMLAKSVYVPLSAAVTPTFGGAGWLLNLTKNASTSSRAAWGRQRPIGQALAIEPQQVLVEMTRAEGVPAVELRYDRQVAEPVVLKGLVEVPRGVCGHVRADVGDLPELGLADRIGLSGSHVQRELRVPAGEKDQGVAGNIHRHKLLALGVGVVIAQPVKRRRGRRDVALEVQQALAVDLVVQDGVPRRPLLHELREHAGLVGLQPGRGHGLENAVPHAPPTPVRDHLLLVRLDALAVDVVAGLGPAVQDAEVLDAVAGQFGISRHDLGPRTPLADNQLVVAQPDRLVAAQVHEGPGAHYRHGIPALVGLVEVRHQHGPLVRQFALGIEARLAQTSCTLCHTAIHLSLRSGRTCAFARPRCPSAGSSAQKFFLLDTACRAAGTYEPLSHDRPAGLPVEPLLSAE